MNYSSPTEEIINKIKQYHHNWEEKCLEKLPNLVLSRRKKYNWLSANFNSLWMQLTILIIKIINKKINKYKKKPIYIFEGLRYKNLIDILPASEVLILGGRSEFFYCLRKGYKFYWIGYIAKSFQLYIYANKVKPFSKAINSIKFFFESNSEQKKYLFLFEDSQPVGMTLSAVLEKNTSINVICIMHGLLGRPEETPLLREGINCKFNLVWDQSHVKIFDKKNEINDTTFVLGLPYEVIIKNERKKKSVILVGHDGLTNDPLSYFYTNYQFCKIYKILKGGGYNVLFRPHPQEDINFVKKIFPDLNRENKINLISSGKMVFIGFYSSLLYEARMHKNLTICLNSTNLPDSVEINADFYITESDYQKIPEIIDNFFEKESEQNDKNLESLIIRFSKCILQIDEYNALQYK